MYIINLNILCFAETNDFLNLQFLNLQFSVIEWGNQ